MGSLRRELERLRELADPSFEEDWPLDEQLADVADKLDRFIHFHSGDSVRYVATDREIHLLGLLCAGWELGEDGGEYTFPSGLTVRLIREGDGFLIDVHRRIGIEDLPDWTHEHVERMDPKKQAKRDRWLADNRDRPFVPWREKLRRVEEEQQRRSEEIKRRDRELLERNRARAGGR
jgi:hypothetical protein